MPGFSSRNYPRKKWGENGKRNTCVEKNMSVFNNWRSCPPGRYLETARDFWNFSTIFLAWEKIFPSVKLGSNPPFILPQKGTSSNSHESKRTKENKNEKKDRLWNDWKNAKDRSSRSPQHTVTNCKLICPMKTITWISQEQKQNTTTTALF